MRHKARIPAATTGERHPDSGRLDPRRPGCTVSLLLALLVGAPFVYLAPRLLQSRDLEGAIPQRALGVVMRVRFAGARTRWGATAPQITVRLGAREVQAIGLSALAGLRPGRTVMLTYLVGKSGQVYIEDAEPITER